VEAATKAKRLFIRSVDWLNNTIESLVSWLIYPLILVMVADIVARFVFLNPLQWARDVSTWLFATSFMLGVAHYYRKRMHISCEDLVYNFGMSASQRAIIDLIHNLILIAIAVALFMPSVRAVMWSMRIGETSAMTVWRPLMWPLRSVIPVTLFMLGTQAIIGLIGAVEKLTKAGEV